MNATWNRNAPFDVAVFHGAAGRLKNALGTYWPARGQNDITERNLTACLLAELALQDWHIWTEVPFPPRRQQGDDGRWRSVTDHLDALAFNPKLKKVCAIETKRCYGSANGVIDDLDRMANWRPLDWSPRSKLASLRSAWKTALCYRVCLVLLWKDRGGWWGVADPQQGQRGGWAKLGASLAAADARAAQVVWPLGWNDPKDKVGRKYGDGHLAIAAWRCRGPVDVEHPFKDTKKT